VSLALTQMLLLLVLLPPAAGLQLFSLQLV
jgi:hypothetical protein